MNPEKPHIPAAQEKSNISSYIERVQKEYEESAKRFALEDPETALWMHERLAAIPFAQLEDVYRGMSLRSGVELSDDRFVYPEKIYIVSAPHASFRGLYDPSSNLYALNGVYFASLREMEKNPRWVMAELVHNIAHENAHATGFLHEGVLQDQTDYLDVGYATVVDVWSDQPVKVGRLFNEGVTEIVAERAARELLKRHPIDAGGGNYLTLREYERFLGMYRDRAVTRQGRSYLAAREFVYRLAAHIAQQCAIPYENVVDGFVSGYFRGDRAEQANIQELIGGDLMNEMANAQTAEDFDALAATFKFPAYTPESKRKLRQLLTEIEEPMRKAA